MNKQFKPGTYLLSTTTYRSFYKTDVRYSVGCVRLQTKEEIVTVIDRYFDESSSDVLLIAHDGIFRSWLHEGDELIS